MEEIFFIVKYVKPYWSGEFWVYFKFSKPVYLEKVY